jgi:hypothetical protein
MYRILSRALIALVVAPTLGALPTPAQAQTMFHACYVPSVGAIYLIQEQGLNQTCLDPAHQEIEWTSGGVESIVDGSITTAKLADGSVTLAKLAPGIHWAQVAANGVVVDRLSGHRGCPQGSDRYVRHRLRTRLGHSELCSCRNDSDERPRPQPFSDKCDSAAGGDFFSCRRRPG